MTPLGLMGKAPESVRYLVTFQRHNTCFVTPFQASFTVFFQCFFTDHVYMPTSVIFFSVNDIASVENFHPCIEEI